MTAETPSLAPSDAPTCSEVAPLRINYGINRRLPGRRITHKCGKLTIAGSWSEEETHKAIRIKIRELNPGWMVTGYCLSDPQNAEAIRGATVNAAGATTNTPTNDP